MESKGRMPMLINEEDRWLRLCSDLRIVIDQCIEEVGEKVVKEFGF